MDIQNRTLFYGDNLEILKEKIPAVDEAAIAQRLWLSSEPDIIIRPGGEVRTSNFLMWQSAYSEWHFTPKLWPEFTKKDLERAISDYQKRERRFGA